MTKHNSPAQHRSFRVGCCTLHQTSQFTPCSSTAPQDLCPLPKLYLVRNLTGPEIQLSGLSILLEYCLLCLSIFFSFDLFSAGDISMPNFRESTVIIESKYYWISTRGSDPSPSAYEVEAIVASDQGDNFRDIVFNGSLFTFAYTTAKKTRRKMEVDLQISQYNNKT